MNQSNTSPFTIDDIIKKVKEEIAKKKGMANDHSLQNTPQRTTANHSPSITMADAPLPDAAFNALITIEHIPSPIKVSSIITAQIKVKNSSSVPWPAGSNKAGGYSINLSYHWYRNDKIFMFDGLRTPLPGDVMGNQEFVMEAQVKAPYMSGEYVLEFDLVQERVNWFSRKGSKTCKLAVQVERIVL